MKRIIITCILLCLACGAYAQQREFRELFGSYTGREGFTSMELSDKMMKMMSRKARADDRALAELLDGIRAIRIVAANGCDEQQCEQFVAQMLEVAANGEYSLMMSQTDEGQITKFYFVDGGRHYNSEFLMVTYGPKENVAVNIYGFFDVKDIARLSVIRPK